MQSIRVDRFGGPEVLRLVDLPDPEPGPDQVVVAVSHAAVTFVETQQRAGTGPRAVTLPWFPGTGVAGTVVSVGEQVDPQWIGARVVATTGGSRGYATHAAVDASSMHRVPATLSTPDALALLQDGRTALALDDAAGVRPGETVAVTAAAGGVGHLLVQLARAAGARTVGLTSTSKVAWNHADAAVDYTDPAWEKTLDAAAPHGLDVVFDGVGSATSMALAARVSAGGRYVQHGAASGDVADVEPVVGQRGARVITLAAAMGSASRMARLVASALERGAGGTLTPIVGQVFALDRVADAHALIEARAAHGKTLLTIGEPS